MAGWRILDLTNFKGRIFAKEKHLYIEDIERQAQIPLVDVAVILLSLQTNVSAGLLTILSDFDLAVLVCDWRKIPVAALLTWREHSRIGLRQNLQLNASLPKQKNAWAKVVKAKILGQANVLENFGFLNYGRLRDYARQVRSGDPNNREAQAAKLYWKSWQFTGFVRNIGLGDNVNAALNYGYTVLRGFVVRAILVHGLSPTLGIYHHNRANPFALADDFIEPFRPAIDGSVINLYQENSDFSLDDAEVRRCLVAAADQVCSLDGFRLSVRIDRLVASYCDYLGDSKSIFRVPVWLDNSVV